MKTMKIRIFKLKFKLQNQIDTIKTEYQKGFVWKGELFVLHRKTNNKTHWTVSHYPTGLSCAHGRTRKQASNAAIDQLNEVTPTLEKFNSRLQGIARTHKIKLEELIINH